MKIGVGRYGEQLRRQLHIPGDGGPAEIEDVIQTCFVLESDRIEWGFLRGERRCIGTETAPALAANLSVVQLINRTGSGVICIVEDVVVTCAGVIQLRRDDIERANPSINQSNLDSRWALGGVAALMTWGQIGAFVGGGQLGTYDITSATVPYRVPFPGMVLLPGAGMSVAPTIVNLGIRASFTWRERAVDRYER